MTPVARLNITLHEVEPQLRRRVDVPLTIKLSCLHDVLQAAMGWSCSHLYEFRAGDVGWGIPMAELDDDGLLPASKASLLNLIEDAGIQTIHYFYDFDDNWHLVIVVEEIDDAIVGAKYPHLVQAIGASPPEDVGGLSGYAYFLEAMADQNHDDHDRMLEWYGERFDPDVAETGRILDNFERLAMKWARSVPGVDE